MNGILLVDKPAGWTSHDVVQKMRRLYETKQVGHTGTLDPMATGLLPICIGKATKVAEYISDDKKAYVARAVRGIRTDTGDTTWSMPEAMCRFPKISTIFSGHLRGSSFNCRPCTRR